MCVKLSPGVLNLDPCSTIIYICGMTTTPRMRSGPIVLSLKLIKFSLHSKIKFSWKKQNKPTTQRLSIHLERIATTKFIPTLFEERMTVQIR